MTYINPTHLQKTIKAHIVYLCEYYRQPVPTEFQYRQTLSFRELVCWNVRYSNYPDMLHSGDIERVQIWVKNITLMYLHEPAYQRTYPNLPTHIKRQHAR